MIMKMINKLGFLSCLVVLFCCGNLMAGEAKLNFEELFRLNSGKIFGGSVELKKLLKDKDEVQVTIHYKEPGQFEKSFEGRGIFNPSTLKQANRNILKNPEGNGEIKDLVAVGRGSGDWRSRFELKGDLNIDFNLHIPRIQRGSQFVLYLHWSRGSFIHTSFFQSGYIMNGGRMKGKAVAPKEYQASPSSWFDQNAVIPVAISLKGGKCQVKLKLIDTKEAKGKGGKRGKKESKEKKKEVELLSIEGAEDLPAGRIQFSFRNLAFVLSNLKISGTLERKWCEAAFDLLESKGQLVLEKKTSEKPKPPERRTRKKRELDQEGRQKEAEVDL